MSTIIQKRKNGSRRVSLKLDTKSHVEQHHRDAININTIMRKYRQTGTLPNAPADGIYGNFATTDDYHSTQDKLLAAQDMFMNLPSDVRSKFDNDAGHFFGFVNDPENLSEAQEMGLIQRDAPSPLSPVGTPKGSPEPSSDSTPQPTTYPRKSDKPPIKTDAT